MQQTLFSDEDLAYWEKHTALVEQIITMLYEKQNAIRLKAFNKQIKKKEEQVMKVISSCVEGFAKNVLIPQVLEEINNLEGIEALGRFLTDQDKEQLLDAKNHLGVVVSAKDPSNINFRIIADDVLDLEDFTNIVNTCTRGVCAYHFQFAHKGIHFFYDAKQYDSFSSNLDELENYEPFLKDKLDSVTIRLLGRVNDYKVICYPKEITISIEIIIQSPTIHLRKNLAA